MSSGDYLDTEVMDGIDAGEFWARRPYPWVNPQYFIRPEHYAVLLETLPDISQFRASGYGERKHGQAGHQRYALDYEEGMELAGPWEDFITELRSDTYRRFVCRLLHVSDVRFRFHWHYTPDGCEVSPHCDSKGKIGSQIFYLNTERDWDTAWGGETVVLDDGGQFPAESAPQFDDFVAEYAALTQDNRSLLFARRGNSWHGVRKIHCPEDRYRKVFIVVYEARRPLRMAMKKLKRRLQGKPLVTDKERLMY